MISIMSVYIIPAQCTVSTSSQTVEQLFLNSSIIFIVVDTSYNYYSISEYSNATHKHKWVSSASLGTVHILPLDAMAMLGPDCLQISFTITLHCKAQIASYIRASRTSSADLAEQ